MMMPGVQLAQSLARWCCGTVRYAVIEEMLLLSDIVRRFLGNLTLGWDELSVKTRWHIINQKKLEQGCLHFSRGS